MPVEFENKTDISGMPNPQPSRPKSASGMQGDTQRKVNHTQQGARVQEGQQQRPGSQAGAARGTGPDTQLPKEEQQWQQQQHEQRPYQGDNPIFDNMINDPWYGYQMGRHILQSFRAFQDTARGHATTSVQNAWEMYPIQASIASQALSSPFSMGNPVAMGLAAERAHQTLWSPDKQGGADIPVLTGATEGMPGGGVRFHPERAGQLAGATTSKEEQKIAGDMAGSMTARALDPTSYVVNPAATKAAWLALAGYGFMGALPQDESKVTPDAVIWAAVAGLLFTNRPLPGPLGAAIKKVLPSWEQVQTKFLDSTAQSIANQHLNGTAEGRLKYHDALLQHHVDTGAMPAYEKVIAKGTKPGKKTVEVEITDYGEIKTKVAEEQKRLDKKLKRFYDKYEVGNLPEFVDKIEHNEITADPKKLKKDWQKLRLPYDLMMIMPEEGQLVHPASHLKDLEDKLAPRGATFLSSLRMWTDHMHRGPHGNDEKPMISLWRNMIGYQRTNNWMHQHMMQTMIRLLGDDAGKVHVQEQLTRAMEGDDAVYQALTPAQKMVADGAKVIRSVLRQQKQATGQSNEFVANWWGRVRKVDPQKGLPPPSRLQQFLRMKPKQDRRLASPGTEAVLQGERKAHRSLKLVMHDAQNPLPAYGGHKGLDPKLSPEEAAAELNKRTHWHGTKEAGLTKDNLNIDAVRPGSMFGPGFYMTDRPGVAESYSRGSKQVYRATTAFRKALDADRPLTDGEKQIVKEAWGHWAEEGKAEDPQAAKALREAIDKGDLYTIVTSMKELLSYEHMYDYDANRELQYLNEELRKAGYDAITHKGGNRGGKQPHQVSIALDPGSQLTQDKSGIENLGSHEWTKKSIALTQKYKTVFDLNAAMAKARADLERNLLDPTAKIGNVDPPLVKEIRQLIQKGEGAKAKEWARQEAADIYPDHETQFLPIFNRLIGRQMSALHSHIAVQHLLDTVWRGKDGKPHYAAYKTQGLDSRLAADLRDKRYQSIDSPWFDGIIVNPEMAKLLRRSMAASLLDRDNAVARLAKIEAKVVQGIMYLPQIHGWNISNRFLGGVAAHPVMFPKMLVELMKGKMGKGGIDEAAWMDMKAEAYRNNVMPNVENTRFGNDIMHASADATGDASMAQHPNVYSNKDIPQWAQHPGIAQVYGLGRGVANGYQWFNGLLWETTGNLGVALFHIEREAALHAGVDEHVASEWAGRRANSWMGHIAPEATNPIMHDLFRLIAFAPNWWRSWAELLTGYYRRSGFDWTPQRVALNAANEVRTAFALYMVQKMSGNILNYVFSGHFQDQNQHGAQDKIEVTRGHWIELLHALDIAKDIDPTTGENSKTGARYTIENPMARQVKDTEEMFGYQSGQPGYELLKVGDPHKHFTDLAGIPLPPIPQGFEIDAPPSPEAVKHGAAKFAAARMAPLAGAAAVLTNVDLYRTLSSGQVSHVNPYSDYPGLDSFVLGALSLLPFGSRLIGETQSQLHKDAREGRPGEVPGPFGLPLPRSVANLKQVGWDSLKTNLFSSMAGINPGYEYSERTKGGPPLTDAQFRQVDKVSQDYKDHMTRLQAELATNQITPAIWRERYQAIATAKATALRTLYGDSSAYVNGTMGLINKYEALFDQPGVRQEDGSIDLDVLAQKQHDFKVNLSAEDRTAMENELSKNDSKWPVLQAYHEAQRNYHIFQAQWAAENGMDPLQLQQEAHAYGKLYSNQRARQEFLGEHPEYQMWQQAKKEWVQSPEGIMYGLFYASPAAVNYAEQQGLDVNQLQQELHQQQPAPAPPTRTSVAR